MLCLFQVFVIDWLWLIFKIGYQFIENGPWIIVDGVPIRYLINLWTYVVISRPRYNMWPAEQLSGQLWEQRPPLKCWNVTSNWSRCHSQAVELMLLSPGISLIFQATGILPPLSSLHPSVVVWDKTVYIYILSPAKERSDQRHPADDE